MQGLYKFRFTTERGTGCGVMFATSGGRLYGGDSGSSFVGSFSEANGVVSCEVTMSRHYHDAKYVPMFEVDNAVMNFTGAPRGEEIHFEGGSAALPGVYPSTAGTVWPSRITHHARVNVCRRRSASSCESFNRSNAKN